ncbi:MAG: hypothetical protein ACRDJM_05510, partial [Actinomycetota bacterium]
FEAGSPGVDRVNAENQERTKIQSLEEVRARKAAAHAAIIAAIRGMSEQEWRAKPGYKAERRRRTAEMLGAILGASKRPFGHAFAHQPDLEAFARTLG